MTAKACFSQDNKKIINVNGKENRGAHCSLPDTIAYWEPEGVARVPLDIALLVSVDEDHNLKKIGSTFLFWSVKKSSFQSTMSKALLRSMAHTYTTLPMLLKKSKTAYV